MASEFPISVVFKWVCEGQHPSLGKQGGQTGGGGSVPGGLVVVPRTAAGPSALPEVPVPGGGTQAPAVAAGSGAPLPRRGQTYSVFL